MNSTATFAAGSLRRDAGVIGLVGLAHLVSHFSHLMLPPLFPWLREAFGASYTELGLLVSLFFVVSGISQASSGFLVDRHGPRPVLFGGLALIAAAAFVMAAAPRWEVLAIGSMLAGLGNGVFHPVDYTLLNQKVSSTRLGHAYSAHGVSGSLGWAVAPLVLVPLAIATSWRVALVGAGLLALGVLGLLWVQRERLSVPPHMPRPSASSTTEATPSRRLAFDFMRLPVVWMCFAYFLVSSTVLGAVQSFAPEAARQIHAVPVSVAALCLSVYMFSNAGGLVVGGFLAADPDRTERVVVIALIAAACVALALSAAPVQALGVLVLFGAMGFLMGCASPSRDVIIKGATPANASGRVYGVVYSGMDIGQALAPVLFGLLMDRQAYQGVWWAMVVLQAGLILTAVRVSRMRRPS